MNEEPDYSAMSVEELLKQAEKVIAPLKQFGYEIVSSSSTSLQMQVPVGGEINRYAQTTKAYVRLREKPSTKNSRLLVSMQYHQKLLVLREEINEEGEYWSYVRMNKREGYVMSEFLELLPEEGTEKADPAPVVTTK